MSKAATKLIALANVLVFANQSDKVQFFASKDTKVKATMAGFDTGKGYDVKLLAGEKDGKEYIRVQANAEGEFVNGVLFPTKAKKTEKSPDYYGQLEAKDGEGNNVIVAKLSAWKKTGQKAGEFLSISIQAPNAADQDADPSEAADPVAAAA